MAYNGGRWGDELQYGIRLGRLFCETIEYPSINPLSPRSDQYVNYPYNFNTLSSRQLMRNKKIINKVIHVLFGYKIKFSGPANKEMYGHQLGELAFRSTTFFFCPPRW